VWGALQGLTVEDIAERVFKLGLTVAWVPSIGWNKKTEKKTVTNVLLWLGDKLSQNQRIDRELEADIGAWAVTLLLNLTPRIFDLDDDKVLILVRTEELDRFFASVINRIAFHDPYVLPPIEPLPPWTGVRQGPFGRQIPLVSRRYSEKAVQQARRRGRLI
jgi:hypothetical protein